jgi:hypothetical protein
LPVARADSGFREIRPVAPFALFQPPNWDILTRDKVLSTAGVLVDFEKLGKLIDQWKGLLAGIAALLVAFLGVHKVLTDLDLRTWSWSELALAALAILLLATVTLRSRRAHLSRLVDPDALKLDPQSPEQLVGRRQDLNKLLRALANPLVFLVSESGCGKSALLQAGVAQGPGPAVEIVRVGRAFSSVCELAHTCQVPFV